MAKASSQRRDSCRPDDPRQDPPRYDRDLGLGFTAHLAPDFAWSATLSPVPARASRPFRAPAGLGHRSRDAGCSLHAVERHDGPIRWGVCATGWIAAQFTAAFSKLDPSESAEIVAVGSRGIETAEAFASTHGIARPHGSQADLAADTDVDIVYVASLQPAHASDATRFLEAGKHVLVEKPFALSATEADRMFAAARANDRFVMEAMWMRFNPGPVDAVERVLGGEIGEVRRIEADFSIVAPDDADHRLRSLEKGGGSLLDLGIYPLTLAWWIAGPPTSWTASGTVSRGIDTSCIIDATWPHATARLTCGLDDIGSQAAVVEGTKGTIEIPDPFYAASSFEVTTADGPQRITTPPASLHHQVAEAHRCLRAGRPESDRNPWAATRGILGVCDGVRKQLGVRYPTEI